ncbi:MAG: hypothetical protein ACN6QT_36445 [Burkholderia contaminans]|uniref:Uncharacterized protein n=1 Tax=Burkholderia contaminans TaxID=488447 RepID=A0AAP4R1W2_9BURK|nr:MULTISPECIES: hypothetical protein [Burkholderia]MBD1410528.1 hypothetical protein [Burkholderia contaminans]MBM6427384.1 hypothetical protein [Burkholderia contaminans]MCA7875639.1 hypothetical protein [Burkholderia contaminans]MDN7564339.1 hypothetical protein [Burkholderia contaminans]MDN8024090.1 hypothetical protein [Burkholderia contaminans]
MAIRNAKPVRFTPKGLCDAFDATDAFAGACQLLSNLVFDQGNPEIVVGRPGVGNAATTFSGFTSPTFVSVHTVIGNVAYGMVSTGRNPGFDEPFAYNLATNTFTTISGVTAGNVPSSPSTSGAWTPPTMAVVGTKILITHPGFNGTGSNFFGVIDISNPAAPAWSSSNLATNGLSGVPTSVANFNNRAWFAVGNTLQFSDPLAPLTRTNATQAVTVGDTTPITAQSGLPIQTTTAGVIGALVVFKASQVWQITGDPTTNNLALNYVSLTTGCIAARSVVQGPFGIFFAGVDAPYILNFLGTLVPLSSRPGTDFPADLQVPFQNTTQPSRISAAFAGNIYRTCVPTLIQGQQQTNDYWYDIRRKRWTGPHTFLYDCASLYGESFVLSGASNGAALFVSTTIPSSNSSYLDAGSPFLCHLRSSNFPKTQHMQQVQVVESTIELAATGSPIVFNLTALDDQKNTLASTFAATPGNGAIWNSFNWGAANWSSNTSIPHVYTIPWPVALVFQKMSIDVTVTPVNEVQIGTFFARYQDAGYTNQG